MSILPLKTQKLLFLLLIFLIFFVHQQSSLKISKDLPERNTQNINKRNEKHKGDHDDLNYRRGYSRFEEDTRFHDDLGILNI
uniref:Uncharacterized protein n=1 Tax=Meloidogyne incognita TaxID=6306 RepID=A0A914MCZ3_MELIC